MQKKQDEETRSVTGSFRTKGITFIGEQDGSPERELKARLTQRFQSDIHVTEAYLARVSFDAGTPRVALCIEAGEQVQPQVVDAVASEFRDMFKTDQSLDILFLAPEQRERLAAVAHPFYKQRVYRL